MRPDYRREAGQLHNQISLLVAGYHTATVLEALTRALSNTIGFAQPSKDEAFKFCDDTAIDMKHLIEANWAELRAARALSDRSGGYLERQNGCASGISNG